MLEITVKTLDGRNHKFTVGDDTSVRQFKDEIASSIEIEADVQRLIYQGRVLADEKKINDYDVNGKTVHVVMRPPPSSRTQTGAASGVGASPTRGQHRSGGPRGEANSFVLGSFSLPADAADPNQVQNMVQQMLSGMGDLGRAHITTQNSGNGSVDVHINVTPNPQQSDAQNRMSLISRMMTSARQTLGRLQSLSDGRDGNDVPMETTANDIPVSASSSSRSTGMSGTSSSSSYSSSSSSSYSYSSSSSSSSGQSSSAQRDPSSQPTAAVQDPVVLDLARILGDVLQFNEDFAPHLSHYHQLMTNDPDLSGNPSESQRSQRLCDMTSEALHHMSHVYHSLSDLVVDVNQPPPRRVRAMTSAVPQAIIQQTIPVQAQISVAHVPVGAVPVPPSARVATAATAGAPDPQAAAPQTSANSTSATTQPATSAQPSDTAPQTPPNSAPSYAGDFHGRMPSPWEMGVPRFRIGVPFARPPGFHMVVEMSQDGTSAGVGSAGQPESSQPPSGQQTSGAGAGVPFQEGGFQFPSGDFMQNIIQMAGAALQSQSGQQVFVLSQGGNMQPITVGPSAINRQAVGASSTAPSLGGSAPSSVGSSTTTTPSAPAANGGGGGGGNGGGGSGGGGGNQGQGANPLRAGAFAGPRISGVSMPPGTGAGLHFPGPSMGATLPGIFVDPFGLIPAVDPYLPCGSCHFIPRRNNQPSANPLILQPQSLAHQFVSSLVLPIITPQGATAPPPGEHGVAAAPPLARLIVVPNLMAVSGASQALASSQQAAMGGGGGTSAPPQAPSAGALPSDEVISRMIQGIGAQLTSTAFGQPAGLTIADFLNSLGNEFNISQGEGLLTDLFNCIAQHLVFSDLMLIFFGQVGPLERLRVPLRTFVSTRVLGDLEPTGSNVEESVDRLVSNMAHDIEETAAACESFDHIDYAGSLTRFVKMNLINAIHLILNATDNGQFGQALYNHCRLIVHEFLNLSRFCLVGGCRALDTLMQNRLQAIASEVSPAMQMSMVQMARQQLHQVLPSISMRDEDIQRYVVLRQVQQSASVVSGCPSGNAGNTQEASVDVKLSGKSEPVSMETEPLVSDRISGNGIHDGAGTTRISPELLARLPPPPTHDDDDDQVHVVIGSEEWHAKVPTEWIPVLTRDAAKQRRQDSQSSLSDAYLTGMPSKRRKVMSHERQREELADVRVALPETIRRAAQQVEVQPVTSFSELSDDAAASPHLRSAFQEEIGAAIRRRIAADPDFSAARFPNASKFFDAKE